MSEHTPSPQSVVVPVEPTEAMHYAGDRILANAVTKGGGIYDTTKAMWSAMLADAPAPSSLAGGEEHVAAARFARLYGIVRRILWTDASTPSLEGASGQALSDLAEFLFMDGIDAALSPEAPAREGECTDRCSCQHGRDHDGSEFGPCPYCENQYDEERISECLNITPTKALTERSDTKRAGTTESLDTPLEHTEPRKRLYPQPSGTKKSRRDTSEHSDSLTHRHEAPAEPWYGDRDPHEVDQAYGNYDGTSCELCHRERVMIGGATGKRICEKCGLYQEAPAEGAGERDCGDGHMSDCAIHNAPALPVGPCDCGSPFLTPDDIQRAIELRADPDSEDNERFASWYGDALLEVHQRAIQMDAALRARSSAPEAREGEVPEYAGKRREGAWAALTSYCPDETDGCTDLTPCRDCLKMVNVFEGSRYVCEMGALPALTHPAAPSSDKLLECRDNFIVSEGLWEKFVSTLSTPDALKGDDKP